MNPTLEQMAAHRSVRRFLPTPVTDAQIEAAVRAARMASTSSWVQAYHLLQVTAPGRRQELAALCGGQAQVHEAGAFFVISGEVRRHQHIAAEHGASHAGNLETFLTVVIDAALFAQNLALAFESQGLGICMIGGLRNQLPEVDALLDLPHGLWPLFGMCVGHAAEVPDQRPRLAVEALWSKDSYPDDATLSAQIAEHDAEASQHYAARGLAGRNWSGGVVRKFAKPTREHLFGYYTAKGARIE
ncbi:MAG: nitroreductase family protein [Planctomycetota bacterium]|nr:nitroreductase family protein [Planctomycetota bacterium]